MMTEQSKLESEYGEIIAELRGENRALKAEKEMLEAKLELEKARRALEEAPRHLYQPVVTVDTAAKPEHEKSSVNEKDEVVYDITPWRARTAYGERSISWIDSVDGYAIVITCVFGQWRERWRASVPDQMRKDYGLGNVIDDFEASSYALLREKTSTYCLKHRPVKVKIKP